MVLQTSGTIGQVEKTPFYYISHPHEAYLSGYNTLIGKVVNQKQQNLDAYGYYLPLDVIKLIPVINEYFYNLIITGPSDPEKQRRKSYLESIDVSVGILSRIFYLNSIGNQVNIGSRYIKPTTWAVFGEGKACCQIYRYQFYNINSVIEHYVNRYILKTCCHPVCVYYGLDTCNAINTLSRKSKGFVSNAILAAAIHLMYDMIEHGGPDVNEFFDLYTNDLTCSPDEVNIDLWQKCRSVSLATDSTTARHQPSTKPIVSVYTPPPLPKPTKIKVTITDEGDDLSKGCNVTKFNAIKIFPHYSNNTNYSDYYYN